MGKFPIFAPDSLKQAIMKKVLLFIACCLLMACSKTPEQRAEALVRGYLERVADDPSSVQDIDVGVLVDKVQLDLHSNKIHYKMASVSYRANNAYGALVKGSVLVKFNEDVTEIICTDCY